MRPSLRLSSPGGAELGLRSVRTAAAQSCSSCGEQAVRYYRRLEGSGGLRIVGTAAATAAALAGVALSSIALLLGGLGALVGVLLLPRLGVRWWGGARCTACGHVEMLR